MFRLLHLKWKNLLLYIYLGDKAFYLYFSQLVFICLLFHLTSSSVSNIITSPWNKSVSHMPTSNTTNAFHYHQIQSKVLFKAWETSYNWAPIHLSHCLPNISPLPLTWLFLSIPRLQPPGPHPVGAIPNVPNPPPLDSFFSVFSFKATLEWPLLQKASKTSSSLFIRFYIGVKFYSICLSLTGLFHLA